MPLLSVGGLPVGVSICYEDVYAREVTRALPAAAYLVNVSNDAWFGDSTAPHQHLDISRCASISSLAPLAACTALILLVVHDGHGWDLSPLEGLPRCQVYVKGWYEL